MKKSKPLVSVVTITYNSALYLPDCLESINRQTYQHYEHLIIDDGSTDQTERIVTAYQTKNDRVKYVYQEHQGRVVARNRGLQEAGGKYLAVLDADDIALPQRLSVQVEYLEKDPELAGVGSWAYLINQRGKEIGRHEVPTDCQQVRETMIRLPPFVHPTVIYRRHILEELGGFNLSFPRAQDYELMLRLVARYRFENLPKYLVKYRQYQRPGLLKDSLHRRWYATKARWLALHNYGYHTYQDWQGFLLATGLSMFPDQTRAWLRKTYRCFCLLKTPTSR